MGFIQKNIGKVSFQAYTTDVNSTRLTGVPMGCAGSMTGSTNITEVEETCDGIKTDTHTNIDDLDLTLGLRFEPEAFRVLYGLFGLTDGYLEGVQVYKTTSVSKVFLMTAEISDFKGEFIKLIALPNVRATGGLAIAVDNTTREISFTDYTFKSYALDDAFYYERIVPNDDAGRLIATQWHSQWTEDLVLTPAP